MAYFSGQKNFYILLTLRILGLLAKKGNSVGKQPALTKKRWQKASNPFVQFIKIGKKVVWVAKNHIVTVRLNEDEKKRIIKDAESSGHKTISTYARACLLNREAQFDRRLEQLLATVLKKMGIEKEIKKTDKKIMDYM